MPVTRSGHPGQNTSLARSQPGQRQAGPSESAGGRHEPSADVFSAYGLSTGRRSVAVRIDKRTLRRPDTGRSAPASWVSGNHPLRTRLRDVELATSGCRPTRWSRPASACAGMRGRREAVLRDHFRDPAEQRGARAERGHLLGRSDVVPLDSDAAAGEGWRAVGTALEREPGEITARL
jgi:hypothetical protein